MSISNEKDGKDNMRNSQQGGYKKADSEESVGMNSKPNKMIVENKEGSENIKVQESEEAIEKVKLQDSEKAIEKTNVQETQEVIDMKKPMNIKNEIFSWIAIAILAYLLANFITNCVIIKAVIPSDSMENTIMTGDKIIGNRLAYLFTSPKRGDIVIFKFPDDETKDYIKRIIGLPGETVEIKDESVYIYNADGELMEGPLDEPYLKEVMFTQGVQTFTVPENSYFMMGDNRNISDDARYWTNSYVHIDKILGKAWFRYKPSLGFIE